MDTKHITTLLTLAGALVWTGCFPEAEVVWGDEPPPGYAPPGENAPEEEESSQLEPFGPTYAADLVQGTADDPVADCAASAPGLAADTAGLAPGGRYGVGRPEIDVDGRADRDYLMNEFASATAAVARERPLSAGCIEEGIAGRAVAAVSVEGGAVGALLRHAADVAGEPAWRKGSADRGDLRAALEAICAQVVARFDPVTGEPVEPELADVRCGPGQGQLPAELEAALTPVVWAIHDGVAVREAMDRELEARDAEFWRRHGGRGLLAANDNEGFNSGFEEDRRYLTRERGKLYGAAAAIADAVQSVDWRAFSGDDVSWDFETPAGWVMVRGSGADSYGADTPETLLLVDLGGNDTHLDEVASNRSGSNSVSVVVDVDGEEFYGYDQASATANLSGPRLPRDQDGAVEVAGQVTGGTASSRARQGAARNGIAMLFDLGAESDRYVALRASQGYAHQGVGVLFDEGGADVYVAEQASQGSAQFGIGLAIDLGNEDDVRRSTNASQGYGFVRGVGLLYDEGGDDDYRCSPDSGGNPLYVAPQMPGEANSSMCQGAGQGFRITDATHSLAGGVGVLVDVTGDDRYEAGVYAQGVGYWEGFGLLSDRSGLDTYDAYYYAQGSAAHFGVGYLADGGPGGDVFQSSLEARTFVLGAANDFSVGVFVNEAGDDVYQIPDRGAGVGSCGSVAVFVDNGGMDTYVGEPGATVAGLAQAVSCGDNRDFATYAVFLDVGGMDDWRVSSGELGNDTEWVQTAGDLGTRRGLGADVAGGDSGVHVGR